MKLGIYEHYKGGRYLVLGTALDANADTIGDQIGMDSGWEHMLIPFEQREVVVYVGVNDGKAQMYVRTLEDFFQRLCGVGWRTQKDRDWKYCYKPLNKLDQCPDHGHMNVRHVARFEWDPTANDA